ncbi:MAG: hypothetical protein E7261_11525 [Lachnospiraceae bacterium]|nr:hypothetical protein [Lachnospiraceae bacterium]
MKFSFFTFPFEQIGEGLRRLSLSGAAGNIVAIVLYVIISLVPCGLFLWLKKKGKTCKADLMLLLISADLFFMIYYMINPGLFAPNGIPGGKEILGCTFYSLGIGYLVLRILAKSAKADTKALQKGLRILLYVVMLFLACVVMVELAFNLPANIRALKGANTAVSGEHLWGDFGNGDVDLTLTYVFLVLQSIVNALPCVLDILVLLVVGKALKEFLEDAYSDEAVAAVRKIAATCSKVLAAIVIAGMSFNILQILFRNSLYNINIATSIPLSSVLFVIAALVIARYVSENQQLKRDNDLFI